MISLDDYKLYKKIVKTDHDADLEFIIASVVQMVKTYCGHSFVDYYTTPKVESFNVNPYQHALLLNEWPVRAITSVEYRDSYEDPYEVLDPVEYSQDSESATLFKHSGYWPQGFAAVKVTYTAGYSDAPGDVQIAALDLVQHYFKEEYKERKTIGAASIDTGSSKVSTTKWPAHVVKVLDMYKNA